MNVDSGAAAAGVGPVSPLVSGDPVSIAVDERLAVRLNKDGGMENMEVQGTMSLQARAPSPRSARATVARPRFRPIHNRSRPRFTFEPPCARGMRVGNARAALLHASSSRCQTPSCSPTRRRAG